MTFTKKLLPETLVYGKMDNEGAGCHSEEQVLRAPVDFLFTYPRTNRRELFLTENNLKLEMLNVSFWERVKTSFRCELTFHKFY